MTGHHDLERTERLLRSVFTEHATGRTAPAALADTVRARHRRRRRLLVSAAAAATVVVGAGVPTGLVLVRSDRPATDTARPGPPPAGDPCLPRDRPLPAPVRADQLRSQSGVRGSLGGDKSAVDAVAVAAWQGMQRIKAGGGQDPDPGSVRVVFVERAGPGVLALVYGRDRSGEQQVVQWVTGRDRWFVPTEFSAGTFSVKPVIITSQVVCGRTFGVVVAPPGSTAVSAGAPRIGADARPVPAPGRTLPLAQGIAVLPIEPSAPVRVTVSRTGAAPVRQQLTPYPDVTAEARRLLPDAEVDRAVRAAGGTPDRILAGMATRFAVQELIGATADEPTGLRVLWGGTLPGGLHSVVFALTLPSGAAYVQAGNNVTPGTHSEYGLDAEGLLPAGGLDRPVLGVQGQRDGLVLVVAPGAARAEVVLSTGTVLPLRLTGGGGAVAAPPGKATLVRAYRADGSRLGTADLAAPLAQLPRVG